MLISVKKTLRDSLDGAVLLLAAIGINLLFFSTCIWLAETSECYFDFNSQRWIYWASNETTAYQSIASSFYWNILTISTVGYGDGK